MKETLLKTNFSLPNLEKVFQGKVRDVYFFKDGQVAMVTTDRISAFDVVLPIGIPYKGQVLNQIAAEQLDAVKDILPTWKVAVPDPMVTIGHRCTPLKIEMVIRGYIAGSAWRAYKEGARTLCGVALPEGLKENEKFPHPIITPTTKADEGHDENISREEIIRQGLVSEEVYNKIEQYTYRLFERGSQLANDRGLILVDTKYEFGIKEGKIYLIDEIHTPDSSRYFYKEGYEERQAKGEAQRQLSKEFVRQWLIDNGFSGKKGEKMPTMDEAFANSVSDRYIELYEHITGKKFIKEDLSNLSQRIEKNLQKYLAK